MEDNKDPKTENGLLSIGSLLWKWMKRLLLGGTFLFVLLFFLLQIPAVQNWTVQQLANRISRATNAKVDIDYIYLSYFDKLSMEGFVLTKLPEDTVLQSQTLQVDFNLKPWVVLSRGLVVEGIFLENAQLNLVNEPGEIKNGFTLVLNELFPKKEKKGNPLQLEIDQVKLRNIQLHQEHKTRGNVLDLFLRSGELKVNQLDLANNLVALERAKLEGTKVEITNNPVSDSALLISLEEEIQNIEQETNDSNALQIEVNFLDFRSGSFLLHNYRKTTERLEDSTTLDFRHMDVFDIDIDIDSFSFQDERFDFGGIVHLISAREQSGFVLHKLAGKKVNVTSQGAYIHGLELITPESNIGDTLVFEYDQYLDFTDFENKVSMYGKMNNSTVSIKDIMVFAPALKQNVFFNNNESEIITIDGLVENTVNNLEGKDLNIELAGDTKIVGDFDFTNLTEKGEEYLKLDLEYLQTSMRSLRQLIPRFNPPENFNNLGTLKFKGNFVGFFSNFVANGQLNTSLGEATVEDMKMDLNEGKDQAKYGGELKLKDFDLGKWTGNSEFGTVNLTTNIIDGVGLTRQNVDANLIANIESFVFRGYNYENALIEGVINYNLFDGSLKIEDENVDLEFIGEINLYEGFPSYEFDATVRNLDLKKLKLSKEDVVLSGDLDIQLQNNSLSDLEGSIDIKNFNLQHNQKDNYFINSIDIISQSDLLGTKTFRIISDILECSFYGIFNLEDIPGTLVKYFMDHYPGFSRKINLQYPKKDILPGRFEYDILILDTKGFEKLLTPKLEAIRDVEVNGKFDGFVDSILFEANIPYIRYDKVELEDIFLTLEGKDNIAEFELAIDSTIINEKQGLPILSFTSLTIGDTLLFGINYSSERSMAVPTFGRAPVIETLNLDGTMSIIDSTVLQFEFDPSLLVFLKDRWNILPDNYIRIDSSLIAVNNLRLSKEDIVVKIDEVNNKGLSLSIENLGFGYLDTLWQEEKVDFKGNYDLSLQVEDIFKMKGLNLSVQSDTFWVNDDDWGRLSLVAYAADLKSRAESYLNITKGDRQLLSEGSINLAALAKEPKSADQEALYFDYNLNITNYPLHIAEYFIGSQIKEMEGSFGADLRFWGPTSKPNIKGEVKAINGAFTVDYLKTRYRFEKAEIEVNNTFFNASGTILRDRLNHTAILYGGITHNHLKNFGIDARLETKRFLALDTKKGDNDMFYGRALGNGEIWFSGDFKQTDIYVYASVSDSTTLTIPVNTGKDASKLQFVSFFDADEEEEQESNQDDLRGLSFEMDLIVKEESKVRIIFDEQAGDIIEGSGRGNLRILLPRGQDFQMYGDYIIENGDYLFTLYNVVNKDFRIRKGSTIQWTGDPFGAEIDIQAEYKDLNTSVANFIQEYLVNAGSDLKNEATNATNVDLTLNLQGALLQPIISFDIDFPNLIGQLQTYTDSKLRVLKQDQNELNKQVFGLILAGQFLPSDFNLQGSQILYNTVSEFVSNQLSLLLTELFSEFIGEDEIINSIDFDIAYSQNQSVDLGEGQDFNRSDEVNVRMKQTLFNDKLSILVGGNLDIGTSLGATPEANGAFLGNDFVLEYAITDDRSLKLRVYQRLEPDIGSGRKFQIGTGLSYRKEFESFSEFLSFFKKDADPPDDEQ